VAWQKKRDGSYEKRRQKNGGSCSFLFVYYHWRWCVLKSMSNNERNKHYYTTTPLVCKDRLKNELSAIITRNASINSTCPCKPGCLYFEWSCLCFFYSFSLMPRSLTSRNEKKKEKKIPISTSCNGRALSL